MQTLSAVNSKALMTSDGFHAAYEKAFGPSLVVLLDSTAKQANTVNKTTSSAIPLFYAKGSFRRQDKTVDAIFKLRYQNHNWLDFAVTDYPTLDLNASDRDFQESLGPFREQNVRGSAGLMFESVSLSATMKFTPGRLDRANPAFNRAFLDRIIGEVAKINFRGVESVKVTLGETNDALKWTAKGWSGTASVPVKLEYVQDEVEYCDHFSLVCEVGSSKNSVHDAELKFVDVKLNNHLRMPKLKAKLVPYIFTALEE
jgi:hypothetical protein